MFCASGSVFAKHVTPAEGAAREFSSGFLAPAGVSLRNMLAWTRQKSGESRILVRMGWMGVVDFCGVGARCGRDDWHTGARFGREWGGGGDPSPFVLCPLVLLVTRPRCATGNGSDDAKEAQSPGRCKKARDPAARRAATTEQRTPSLRVGLRPRRWGGSEWLGRGEKSRNGRERMEHHVGRGGGGWGRGLGVVRF